jgi:hypothetical protein
MYDNGRCESCPVYEDCYYPYKPTECVAQRKFWSISQRQEYEQRKAEETAVREDCE